jgi:hypothetical protein
MYPAEQQDGQAKGSEHFCEHRVGVRGEKWVVLQKVSNNGNGVKENGKGSLVIGH